VSGSGISWAICKSALCFRQITTPAPYHLVFLQAGCPSCRLNNSVKALKATYFNLCGIAGMIQYMAAYCGVLRRMWRAIAHPLWTNFYSIRLSIIFILPPRVAASTTRTNEQQNKVRKNKQNLAAYLNFNYRAFLNSTQTFPFLSFSHFLIVYQFLVK